jgi:hypothetical protein
MGFNDNSTSAKDGSNGGFESRRLQPGARRDVWELRDMSHHAWFAASLFCWTHFFALGELGSLMCGLLQAFHVVLCKTHCCINPLCSMGLHCGWSASCRLIPTSYSDG